MIEDEIYFTRVRFCRKCEWWQNPKTENVYSIDEQYTLCPKCGNSYVMREIGKITKRVSTIKKWLIFKEQKEEYLNFIVKEQVE